MIEKLKLSFCLSSDLETPEMEEAAARYFDNERKTLLDKIVENLDERHIGPFSPKTFNFKNWAQKYIECPVMLHPAFEPRAKKELANLAQLRLSNLIEVLDMEEAELLSIGEDIEPKTKIFLVKRISRLLATLAVWEDNLKNGEFDVYQTRPHEKMPEHFERFPQLITQYNPNNTGRFPAIRFNVPWNPAAVKAKKEPEEFRQIWLNPEEDIPFVLEALKRLEFIDENEVWRVAQYRNPLGPIIALIEYPKHSFFHNMDRIEIERAFCQRFKVQQPKKGFKPENRPFENSKKMMLNYLREHS